MKIIDIDNIKKQIINLTNNKIRIKIYMGRNKYEYYNGEIDKIYPNIFSVKTEKGIKSFSYLFLPIYIFILI